jgi:D-glycero-alpha-D-manno-heptose-7-phosphate kinase
MIITRTPYRISLFGGGTDYPAWFKENGGAVLATSIDKYCYISVRHLPPFFEHKHRIVYSKIEHVMEIDQIQHPLVRAVLSEMKIKNGLEIHHDGDLPARSGLGSSSSFAVGMLNAIYALQGKMTTKNHLANEAIRIEQDMLNENVGCQDQITTAYGGINRIDFRQNGDFDVNPVIGSAVNLDELQGSMMLFFTGITRFASDIAGKQIENFSNTKAHLTRMHAMVSIAADMIQNSSSLTEDIGALIDESWMLKRELASSVSNPTINAIYEKARAAGAIGGKILGAGAGGFILFIVAPENQSSVRECLKDLVHVDFKFEANGSKVVLFEPNGLNNI